MSYSAVLIIPKTLHQQANDVAAIMGWGPESYSVPLGDGETVTHYGLRADVSGQFIRWIRGQDPLPEAVAALAAPVISALISDFSPDPDDGEKPVIWGRDHFAAVCADSGLVPVPDDPFEDIP
jgi:hypothetical protein